MAILLNAYGIKKAFGARPLFENLSFSIESGDKIGLIGPNGAGKSTLLKILAGKQQVDEGKLTFARALKVGFLEQTPQFEPDATIFSALMQKANPHLEEWESHMKAYELIAKFEFEEQAHVTGDALVASLSGGWKKRVALAAELMQDPDLLLLDEPTNHLDVESILWLENLIEQASCAVLTITHDRLFLQRIAQRILELDRRNVDGILNVQGDYLAYLEVKEHLIHTAEQREVVLKNTLRRETEWLRQGAKARTTKQQARIDRAGALKEEVQGLQDRNQVKKAQLQFHTSQNSPKKLIEAKNVAKEYEKGVPLFVNLNAIVVPGTRIGLLGPNGAGKSTLIRVLLGEEQPSSGSVFRAQGLSVAYFEQNRDALDPRLTVSQTLCPSGDFVSYKGNMMHIRSYLDKFLFTQGQMDMQVGKLSGGEQSRILLAKLMLHDVNLLVLDEPTNDLDFATLNVLEDCLVQFPGAVLFVSHDRYFVAQVATQILAINGKDSPFKQVCAFANLEQWEIWHTQQKKDDLLTLKKNAKQNAKEAKNQPAAQKEKKSSKNQFELQQLETNIQKAETQITQLKSELCKPAIAGDYKESARIASELDVLVGQVDGWMARWAELEK
jgi:ATP-binding cassette subfamily F protein uup